MDKIEKIRQNIERLKKTEGWCEVGKDTADVYYARGFRFACDNLLSFLDTLSEEPNKSPEEAAEELFETIEIQEHENIFEDTFKKIFIAGAEWKKEQMLKDAIKAYIVKSYNPCTEGSEPSLHGIELVYEDKNKPYLLADQKVRIVVLKEKEE